MELTIVFVLAWALFAWFCGWLMVSKGRSFVLGVVLALVLGPLGLAVCVLASPGLGGEVRSELLAFDDCLEGQGCVSMCGGGRVCVEGDVPVRPAVAARRRRRQAGGHD